MVAQALVAAAMDDLRSRYGGEGDETPVSASDFEPPNGAFLVAYLDGEPVACAGWRSHGTDGKTAELKRMFTLPAARRRGIARRVLAAVEESARSYGRTRMILETGGLQPEAIKLYQSNGYECIEHFGYYKDAPDVVSLGRDL
ncbi:MAG TPA: GNAT family N-acetyltransferase [Natronosporangium sp.]